MQRTVRPVAFRSPVALLQVRERQDDASCRGVPPARRSATAVGERREQGVLVLLGRVASRPTRRGRHRASGACAASGRRNTAAGRRGRSRRSRPPAGRSSRSLEPTYRTVCDGSQNAASRAASAFETGRSPSRRSVSTRSIHLPTTGQLDRGASVRGLGQLDDEDAGVRCAGTGRPQTAGPSASRPTERSSRRRWRSCGHRSMVQAGGSGYGPTNVRPPARVIRDRRRPATAFALGSSWAARPPPPPTSRPPAGQPSRPHRPRRADRRRGADPRDEPGNVRGSAAAPRPRNQRDGHWIRTASAPRARSRAGPAIRNRQARPVSATPDVQAALDVRSRCSGAGRHPGHLRGDPLPRRDVLARHGRARRRRARTTVTPETAFAVASVSKTFTPR